jgi:hypothetical protein
LLNTYSIFLRAGLTEAERTAGSTLADLFADGEGRRLDDGDVLGTRI